MQVVSSKYDLVVKQAFYRRSMAGPAGKHSCPSFQCYQYAWKHAEIDVLSCPCGRPPRPRAHGALRAGRRDVRVRLRGRHHPPVAHRLGRRRERRCQWRRQRRMTSLAWRHGGAACRVWRWWHRVAPVAHQLGVAEEGAASGTADGAATRQRGAVFCK